ncbi:MAG: hypothetical protein ACE5R4_05320, partial [Armatimonadota bacterium]
MSRLLSYQRRRAGSLLSLLSAVLVLAINVVGAAQEDEPPLQFSATLVGPAAEADPREYAPGEPIGVLLRLENKTTKARRVISPMRWGVWFDFRDSEGDPIPRVPTTIVICSWPDADAFLVLQPGAAQTALLDLTLALALPPDGAVTGRVMYSGNGSHGCWRTEPGLPSEEISIVLRSPPERPAYGYLGLVGAKWWHAEMALDLALR